MHAVFFDLDGTLFDTKADLAATVNHTRRDLVLSVAYFSVLGYLAWTGGSYLLG